MLTRAVGIVALTALMAAALWVALPGSTVEAQATPGAEIRLAARDFGNGSVSVGLQHRRAGTWRSVTPTRHILPASAGFNHWYTTSATEIAVVQASVEIGLRNRAWTAVDGPDQFTVTIGGTRYIARCGRLNLKLQEDGLELRTGSRNCDEVIVVEPGGLANPTDVGMQVLRVAARRLPTGGIELGIQRLVGGQWEALRQPIRPVLTGLSRSAWRFTSSLQLPTLPAHVFGDLRRGVSITTRDSEFDLEVDGRVYRSRCGVLELGILTEHILVDTATDGCHGSAPLLTICPTSDCDVQQNAAYAWESRQVGESLDQIEVTRSEAQTVVNAIFADFFPRSRAPTVSFSGEQSHGHAGGSEIVLGTSVRNLGAVVHELAHSLVDRANVRDAGHGGAFTAMLLYLWERYFPIADVHAARDDAERRGIEVALRPPIQTRFSEARQAIGELFCDQELVRNEPDLCDAASGGMARSHDGEIAGLYTGWGGNDQVQWYAFSELDNGDVSSYLDVTSEERHTNQPVARLIVSCRPDEGLSVTIRWRHTDRLSGSVDYRIDDAPWSDARWQVSQWTEGAGHRVHNAVSFLRQLHWHASGNSTLQVRDSLGGSFRFASFQLTDVFETPVQRNLLRCGLESTSLSAESPILDWGNYGDDFWWGVDEEEQPLKSFVVRNTNISGSSGEVRLSVQCEDGGLELDLYWEVAHDLDWTVSWRVSNGAVQTGEWLSGTGTWTDNDIDYRWTGLKDAGDLISQMAWAAQSGGSFTVEAHVRNDPNRRFTATFDLDGLFDTPVQPNLARCGR